MTDAPNRPPARLAILFARDAPIAAIFRTGPVNTTALIEWNTKKDTFRLGQWVRHKVYPERSALSPDGKHLVYFAYRYHLRDGTRGGGFTVISRMPYFTARAMFVEGGTWGGGGAFLDSRHLVLRGVGPSTTRAALPDGLRLIYPAGLFARRRAIEADAKKGTRKGLSKRIAEAERRFAPGAPYVYDSGKPAPIAPGDLRRFARVQDNGLPIRGVPPLPDWYVVRNGCLYRRDENGKERMLKDFNAMEFQPLAAPYG
jgi:hypothetical protein